MCSSGRGGVPCDYGGVAHFHDGDFDERRGFHRVGVGDVAVVERCGFLRRERGASVCDFGLFARDGHSQVAGVWKDSADRILAVGLAAGAEIRCAGLRTFLVNDAVELLVCLKAIVSVEDGGEVVGDEQLANRRDMTLTDTFEKVFILTLPGAEEWRAVLEGHLRKAWFVLRGTGGIL